ncbi:hypothetical protein CPHO_11135 [Corynebacterium phocae]|uniref:Carrier domain-containing protein n=1 Tax=Corynebacterium phocae TaxID=161895 RepID=A0A1L7D5M9_9CORY|nr:phosphopantetheine-binding protein [Corynebacterium phocae]APT93351.1 hypothetical protein CPHO_11135 [Corynebacterium phocae]KAA8721688.1 isochorismatase [Corynebacterium phocae]
MALSEAKIRADLAAAVDNNIGASDLRDEQLLSDLGLDSMKLIMLTEKWRAEGHEVDFNELIAAPTVGDWVSLLTQDA